MHQKEMAGPVVIAASLSRPSDFPCLCTSLTTLCALTEPMVKVGFRWCSSCTLSGTTMPMLTPNTLDPPRLLIAVCFWLELEEPRIYEVLSGSTI